MVKPLQGDGKGGDVEELFFRTCDRRTGVRFMRVRFFDLALPSGQLTLFPCQSPDAVKKKGVSIALDRIRGKYGEGVVGYGKAV